MNNVSWAPGFNASAMQYAGIGVDSSFPYPGAANFTGAFTNGLANWSTDKGTPGTNSTVTHGGGSSFAQSGDTSVIHTGFVQAQRKRVSVWFHDDTSQTSLDAMARVDKDGWDGPEWRALGVRTATSADKYVYRSGATTTATSVPRTTGWHEFTFDYTSGTGVDFFIDGRLVASPAGVTEFDGIALGDWWVDSAAGTAYWDDISVTSFAQDFEHGLGTFTATKGTATLTAAGHSGTTSYSTDEDTDVITTKLRGKNYQLASVWFYDDAADTSVQSMARADEGASDDASWRGLGVNTSVSATKYVYRVNGTSTAGTVTRTTGWHQATWGYWSGAGVTMSIDGQAVTTAAGVRQFDTISLGDWWGDGNVGPLHFDNVVVSNKLTNPARGGRSGAHRRLFPATQQERRMETVVLRGAVRRTVFGQPPGASPLQILMPWSTRPTGLNGSHRNSRHILRSAGRDVAVFVEDAAQSLASAEVKVGDLVLVGDGLWSAGGVVPGVGGWGGVGARLGGSLGAVGRAERC